MTLTEVEQGDSGQQSVMKAVFLFFAAFALYFFTHSPALDEIDAVQFAIGVTEEERPDCLGCSHGSRRGWDTTAIVSGRRGDSWHSAQEKLGER